MKNTKSRHGLTYRRITKTVIQLDTQARQRIATPALLRELEPRVPIPPLLGVGPVLDVGAVLQARLDSQEPRHREHGAVEGRPVGFRGRRFGPASGVFEDGVFVDDAQAIVAGYLSGGHGVGAVHLDAGGDERWRGIGRLLLGERA